MADEEVRPVRVPPRWAHRALYRVTNGRKGEWTPANKRGWGEREPAWWLNLQAHAEATVHLADGPSRRVSAPESDADEHA